MSFFFLSRRAKVAASWECQILELSTSEIGVEGVDKASLTESAGGLLSRGLLKVM